MIDLKNKIVLNIIPVLKSGINIVKPGQVCSAKSAEIKFFSALSYNMAYYTNVDGEDPIAEADLIDTGRTSAMTGYGCGDYTFDTMSGRTLWKPMQLLKFISMEKLAKAPELDEDPMPMFFKPDDNGSPLFNVDTGEENLYSPVNGVELLMGTAEACEWAGIKLSSYIKKLKYALENFVLGWSTGITNIDITTANNITPGSLSVFKVCKDNSVIKDVLNSRINNILPY